MLLRFTLIGMCWVVLPLTGAAQVLPAIQADAFGKLRILEADRDLTNLDDLWFLVRESYQQTLYGSSRQYARRVLAIEPNHRKARDYLGYKQVGQGNAARWLDLFERTKHQGKQFRHPKLGWIAEQDRAASEQGRVRAENGTLATVAELDGLHRTWARRRTIHSRFFDISGGVPLEAMWFVADDLDDLALAYCDLFELPTVPQTRFKAHLYRTTEDADAAGTDGKLLQDYGAYFMNGTLHVMFRSTGGITAVRHEAAHALNRVYMRRCPQWVDEGLGVYFQFAYPQAAGGFEFGRFWEHRYAMELVKEVRFGREFDARVIVAGPHLKYPQPLDYSKFRAVVDFLLVGEEQRHRARFLNTLFRNQGSIDDLLSPPGFNQAWLGYVQTLQPDPKKRFDRDAARSAEINQLMADSVDPPTHN